MSQELADERYAKGAVSCQVDDWIVAGLSDAAQRGLEVVLTSRAGDTGHTAKGSF